MRKLLLSFMMVVLSVGFASAQMTGKISGTVIDESTGEGLPFANVVLYQNGVQKGGAPTDFDGTFSISGLKAGTYDIKFQYTGYNPKEIQGVTVRAGATERLDVSLSMQVTEQEVVEVVIHEKPLINQDQTISGQTLTSKEIQAMPTREISTMANMGAGTFAADDGASINMGGARSNNTVTYINGVKVIGNISLPPAAIDQMQVMMRGLPAQFGDVTGGVINITTKGASSRFFGGINAESSNMFDKWNQNVVNLTVSGPILASVAVNEKGDTIKDAQGNPLKDTKLGYFASVQYLNHKDPRPSGTPIYQVNEDVYQDILDEPLFRSGNGYSYKADLLTMDDLHTTKVRPNVGTQGVQGSVNLDFIPNKNTTITLGGSYDYANGNNYIRLYSLLNSGSNPQQIDNNYNVFARLRQNIGGKERGDSTTSTLTNAYYQIQFDYSKSKSVVQDPNHKDNFFRYGHAGYFSEEFGTVKDQNSPHYLQVMQSKSLAQSAIEDGATMAFYASGSDVFMYTGDGADDVDSLVGSADASEIASGLFWQIDESSQQVNYERSEYNPLASNYLTQYFDLEEEINFDVTNLDVLTERGLFFNGRRSNLINGLWFANGRAYNGYSVNDNDQFRLSALAAAEINKKHTFKFGFEYEQRDFRYYSINPLSLWGLVRNDANEIHKGYDYSASKASEKVGGYYYYDFDYNVDKSEQPLMDAAIREKYGYSDQVRIQPFNLEPDDLSVEDLSANDMWNFGMISYSGYDKAGNRIKNANIAFEDYFLDSLNRPQASFVPNYAAFFVEDKFEIEDLIIRIGLRVDRYDANQSVLKDRYSTVELQRVGETNLENFGNSDEIDLSSGVIQDDWAIIVDQSAENYSGNNQGDFNVLGFRDGSVLYDVQGNEVQSGRFLSANNEPLNQWFDVNNLTGNDTLLYTTRKLTTEAFEDYVPQYNFMPRIAFSFPISEDAGFYAHYDVLTQRPNSGFTAIFPSSYYFLSQNGGFLANPDLKPERTINYQLGFQQKLSQYSALKLEAYYNERRDQIGVVRVEDAYPNSYITYDNVDNSTSRGLTVTYDMRKKKNLSGNVSYTLAYASGTGSSANTSLSLVSNGFGNISFPTPLDFDQRHAIKATLDYRVPDIMKKAKEGEEASGGRSIFANSGANFTIIAGSGTPFTRNASRQSEILQGVAAQTKLDGSINGSRLPWNFRANLKIDKDIIFKNGKTINVYFYVRNVFNNKNVLNVYNNTGETDDDGYLETSAVDSWTQSQIDMYRVALINPSMISLPRRARLGVTYSF